MQALSLSEIEKTLKVLFMNRQARESFLHGDNMQNASQFAEELSLRVLPYIDKNGVRLYADLLSYGHHEVIGSVYPGCAKLIGNDWENVVDHYLETYPPKHYNLNQSAKYFAQYLAKYCQQYLQKFPFLIELADYEWVELELLESNEEPNKASYLALTDPKQFEELAPLVNNVLLMRKYNYPIPYIVDQLRKGNLLKTIDKRSTSVAVYRDPETKSCRFLELEELSAALIESACEKSTSYKELMTIALLQSSDVDPQQIIVDFLELVEKLQSINLFVGSIPVCI